MAVVCNTRLFFHITTASCFFPGNDFGQNNPSLVTHTTVAIVHVAHTRHVPRRMHHPCLCTTSMFKMLATNIFKCAQPAYSNIGTCCKLTAHNARSSSTRHIPRRLPHPWPCTIGVIKIKYITKNSSPLTYTRKAATDTADTRPILRRVPR